MFRNNPFSSILVSVLFLASLATCWFGVRYFFSVRELQDIQFRYQHLVTTQNTVQSLISETMAYSQQHPAIEPILKEFRSTNRVVSPAPAIQPAR